MDITTNNDWQWAGDHYQVAFATTSDPRVLAVIEREDEYGGGHIDGDVYAPAFYFERGRKSAAGSTFMDHDSEEIAEVWATARYYFVNYHYRKAGRRPLDYDTVTARYMRIFHNTTVAEVSSSIDRDSTVYIFNTPTWREHIGWTDEYAAQQPVDIRLTDEVLAGDVDSWQAALDGDVYGIGWATNVGRVMHDDEEIDPRDVAWTMNIECWGFLGEEYAKEAAARFECGTPDLEPMLDDPDIFGDAKRVIESRL